MSKPYISPMPKDPVRACLWIYIDAAHVQWCFLEQGLPAGVFEHMLTNSFLLRLKKLKACEILQRSIIEHDIEEIVTKKNQKNQKKEAKREE